MIESIGRQIDISSNGEIGGIQGVEVVDRCHDDRISAIIVDETLKWTGESNGGGKRGLDKVED